jgi:hypothetical protein
MPDDDAILFWNHQANEANRFDHTAPMQGVRQGGADTQLACDGARAPRDARRLLRCGARWHRALFRCERSACLRRPCYGSPLRRGRHGGSANGSRDAYPEQIPSFERAALSWATREGTDERAHEYGRRVAFALLANRADDGASAAGPAYVYPWPAADTAQIRSMHHKIRWAQIGDGLGCSRAQCFIPSRRPRTSEAPRASTIAGRRREALEHHPRHLPV